MVFDDHVGGLVPFVNADRNGEHRIDEDLYRARLKERWKYLARPKGKSDDEGHVRIQCLAANPWPVARCDLKCDSTTKDNRGRLRITVRYAVASQPPRSCTQQSVSIPPGAGAKFHQELLYGSAEW
jgi:hypothetical protein